MEKKEFNWNDYYSILNDKNLCPDKKCQEANKYFFLNRKEYLYKYFSLPSNKKSRNKRLNQISKNQFWLSNKELLNDPFEFELADIGGSDEKTLNYYKEIFETRLLLCMTDTPDNPLMWSHYANSHKGFCIEFKCMHAITYPVIYIDRKIDFKDIAEEFVKTKNNLFLKNYSEDKSIAKINALRTSILFCLKSKIWDYEKEYRLIKVNKKLKSNGKLYNLKDLDLEISRIICGLKCTEKDKEDLKHICQYLNETKFNKFKEYCNSSKYKNKFKSEKQMRLFYYKIYEKDLIKFSKVDVDKNFNLKIIDIDLKEKNNG